MICFAFSVDGITKESIESEEEESMLESVTVTSPTEGKNNFEGITTVLCH